MISPIHFQRASSPRDIDRLYPVEIEAFEPEIWPKERFLGSLDNPDINIQMAVAPSQQVVGYAMYSQIRGESSQFHLDSLAVGKAARGHKVGEQLLLWGIGEASRQGYPIMQLEVEKTNSPAIHLYQKYGFEPTKDLPGYYYGRDGQAMQIRELQSPTVQARIQDNRQQLIERLGQVPCQHYALG